MITGAVSKTGAITGKVLLAEEAAVTELTFSNRLEFPNIGQPGKLYIATDENAVYRFDAASNTYEQIRMTCSTIQSKLKEES